jgi:hypothetical protein
VFAPKRAEVAIRNSENSKANTRIATPSNLSKTPLEIVIVLGFIAY